jgi:hypothetical protein
LFNRLDKRGQVNVLESLQYLQKIEQVAIPSKSGRGQAKNAWVAVQEPED